MVLSIISTKGGVGKTTLSANLAGYLTSIGKSVLMIDADPQPSLSSYYKLINNIVHSGLVDVCKSPNLINDCINQTEFSDLIISNDSRNELQNYLLTDANGRFKLKVAIKKIKKHYDIIIIDTQGAKGALQDCAVLAADKLISPILPELTTIKEFNRGTLSMLSNLSLLKEMGIYIPKLSGIIYKADNTRDSMQFSKMLFAQDNKQYTMLKTVIPQSVAFKEAVTKSIPVTDFLKNNKKLQTKARKSADAIIQLAEELGLC